MSDKHPEWVDQTRRLLDESAANLDAATLSRLNRGRQAALATRPGTARRWAAWSGGLTVAAVLALAVAVVVPRHSIAPRGTETPQVVVESDADADLDLLGADDSSDLVQDMDFYAWLDAQEHQDG
jgi:hypothetical protein